MIHLSVSQANGCTYCLAAHTGLAKMNGFTDEQIIEIRSGRVSFNSKIDALSKFAREAASNNGAVSDDTLENFYDAGYSAENMIDTVLIIGGKTIANYLHKIAGYAIDFPEAPKLEPEAILN